MPLDGTQKQLGSKMRPSSSIRAFQFNSLDSVLSRIYLVKRINSQLSLKNVLSVAWEYVKKTHPKKKPKN